MATARKTVKPVASDEAPGKIVVNYNGTEYTFEFDRDTVAQTEKLFDVSINDVRRVKMTVMPDLFRGALMKHHPNIKEATVDLLFSKIGAKSEFFGTLAGLYLNSVMSLYDEPDEGEALAWTAV